MIEYDLRRVHGVRMADFWRGKITPRELMVLIKFLPVDSEFVKAVAPDEAELAQYRPGDYIQMAVFDAVVGKVGAYPRPDEVLAKRKEKQRVIAFLEVQAERNRLRDEAEGVASNGDR